MSATLALKLVVNAISYESMAMVGGWPAISVRPFFDVISRKVIWLFL